MPTALLDESVYIYIYVKSNNNTQNR